MQCLQLLNLGFSITKGDLCGVCALDQRRFVHSTVGKRVGV